MDYTRVQIAVEGNDTKEWYILEPGSLKWNEGEEYPIIDQFRFDDIQCDLGQARDIQREDGRITAEIPTELIIRIEKESPHGGEPLVHFGTYVTSVNILNLTKITSEKQRVSDCTLRAIGRVWIDIGNPGVELT